jgi:hypothetical protein
VGFSAGPDALAKRKISFPLWEQSHDFSVAPPVLVTNLTELSGRIASHFSARSLLILSIVVVLVRTNKCQGSYSN